MSCVSISAAAAHLACRGQDVKNVNFLWRSLEVANLCGISNRDWLNLNRWFPRVIGRGRGRDGAIFTEKKSQRTRPGFDLGKKNHGTYYQVRDVAICALLRVVPGDAADVLCRFLTQLHSGEP